MTCFYKARQRAIVKGQYLNDIRFLYLDDIGISIQELRKLETDSEYYAHPTVYGKVVKYYGDIKLVEDICHRCPIQISKDNIIYNDFTFAKRSIYDTYAPIRLRMKRILISKNKKYAEYYYARLRYALSTNIKFKNRNELCIETAIPLKVVSKMENDKNYIPEFLYSNILFKVYKDKYLGVYICEKCPVYIESQKIEGGFHCD